MVVQQIVPGSAADRARITAHDLILHFQGEPIKDLTHFSALVLAAPEGQRLPMEVLHGVKIEQRAVVLPAVTAAPAIQPGVDLPTELAATIVGDDGQTMILIPAGDFIMGEDEPKRIYLDALYIDQYEVTNALWDRVVPVSKRRPKSLCDRCPVINVSWYEAESYCTKVGKRLPTEAEWEKATRGSEGRAYVWGEQFRPGLANVKSSADKFSYTAPIGSFSLDKSPYGVFDLAGNVAEWTASWYQRG
ncbi:MAG: SUMF1/EgtB/PvdO family nonheme iron enzyme, partial [Candidatus Tectimicrobiota bacterium]